LKKDLLNPRPKKVSAAPSVKKEDKDSDDPMSSKHKRVLDWGTPRLVTKNRALNMNP
jgi:hypothetical protein